MSLTQGFEVGSLEAGREVLDWGGSRSGGETQVQSWPNRDGLESASACPPLLPVLCLLSYFVLLTWSCHLNRKLPLTLQAGSVELFYPTLWQLISLTSCH